jgi:hypothetical protein
LTLPQISHSLLALDISANFLVALPPALQACVHLEELNIAANPVRTLPVFLADLESLRVLIADSTGISSLPAPLSALDKLHTLSIRRNKFNSLPSWLCMLRSLETLLVDGNPFQGPWKALVEPLLVKDASTPLYTPMTPGAFSLASAGGSSLQSAATSTDTDTEDLSDPPLSALPKPGPPNIPEEEDTIQPPRSVAPSPLPPPRDTPSPASTLSRRKTAPNRSHFERTRSSSKGSKASPGLPSPPAQNAMPQAAPPEHQMRKMKSAGDLRRGASATAEPASPGQPPHPEAMPVRPALSHYATSASSTNLLRPSAQGLPHRYASLGASSALSAGIPGSASGVSTPNSMRSFVRPPLDQSLWDNISDEDDDAGGPETSPRSKGLLARDRPTSPTRSPPGDHAARRTDKTEKSGRWGFLKKMSMGKMKDNPPPTRPSHNRRPTGTSRVSAAGEIPQIDVRLSTTGTISALPGLFRQPSSDMLRSTPSLAQKPSVDALKIPSSSDLLVPSSPTPRSAKRRSFLMPEGAASQTSSLVIPAPASFMPGLTAANGVDSDDGPSTPSTPLHDSSESRRRREEERLRDTYTRALRSVMAYLRDLNDLSLPIGPPKPPVPTDNIRSRRPTLADGGRSMTDSSIISDGADGASMVGSTVSGISSQLRSSESMSGLRNVPVSQILSVASTDSEESASPSPGPRKFKDDRSKRSMIVREIVE